MAAKIQPGPGGPPRKPKRWGHALWVGNLPPFAQITDLKDFFSSGATCDIRSVFLISKSNCCFVNYESEAVCIAAMNRFHNSRFHGGALVCRLRRSSANKRKFSATLLLESQSSAEDSFPTPSSDAVQNSSSLTIVRSDTFFTVESPKFDDSTANHAPPRVPARFFILKSLAVADLELSRSTGVWATQQHNESMLSSAFQEADNVYLFFSVNKSGEYYGMARMTSHMQKKEIGPPLDPTGNPSTSGDPQTTVTPPTATAPRGFIVDDSARGTLFWECKEEAKEENDEGGDTG